MMRLMRLMHESTEKLRHVVDELRVVWSSGRHIVEGLRTLAG